MEHKNWIWDPLKHLGTSLIFVQQALFRCLFCVSKKAYHNIPIINASDLLELTNNSNCKREVKSKFPSESSISFWIWERVTLPCVNFLFGFKGLSTFRHACFFQNIWGIFPLWDNNVFLWLSYLNIKEVL